MENHNEKQNHSMVWMILPCLLVLAFAVFAGGGLGSWPFLIFIGVMAAGHLWMMFRGHGYESSGEGHHAADIEKTDTSRVDEKKDPAGRSCCH